MNKTDLLTKSKTFCMFPWLHLFVSPRGTVYPCCSHSQRTEAFGNTKTQALADVFNNEQMRTLRMNMLEGKSSPVCEMCYTFERRGAHSYRQFANERFGEEFHSVVPSTLPDGRVPDFRMLYIDVRFSNLCNFKCRTCGVEYSSQWATETKLVNKQKAKPNTDPTLLHADPSGKLLREIAQHLDHAKIIYFAGGEPMMMEEHYEILQQLIAQGRRDITLRYNTNASSFKFKDRDIWQLWQQFDRIEVSASIDHYGERAEYIRTGTDWAAVESNLILLRQQPNIDFQINTVLSVFNYATLPEFYQYLVDRDLYRPTDRFHFIVNTNYPEFYSAAVLPRWIKTAATEKILALRDWARQQYNWSMVSNLEHGVQHANSEHTWVQHRDRLRTLTRELDQIRGTDVVKTFPELRSLWR